MKTLNLSILALVFIFSLNRYLKAQEDTTIVPITEDTTQVKETDPVKTQIAEIIKEVNNRASFVDNIISEGDVKVKTAKMDESGSIEIHVKKKDDVWFDLTGTLGVSGAMAHFNRKNFV